MRLTLAIALVAALAGCTAAPRMGTPDADSLAVFDPRAQSAPQESQEYYGPPAPETLRTEKDLPKEKQKKKDGPPKPAFGHLRVEIQGGSFLEDEVDDIFDSTWGLALSGGFFLGDHISLGGMLDFLAAYDDEDVHFNNQKIGDIETTLTVITLSPMVWFHLTDATEVKNDGTPSLAIGAGPSLVGAYVDYEYDTYLGDYDDDDDDSGWGYQVEAVGEIPLGKQITLAGGARWAVKKMDDFEDLDAIVGFLGIGIRF